MFVMLSYNYYEIFKFTYFLFILGYVEYVIITFNIVCFRFINLYTVIPLFFSFNNLLA